MEFLPHALAAFFALVAIVLNELCKPADRKWKLTGSKWRLPSGPQGKPLIGNLSQFFKARDSGDFVPYLKSIAKYGEMTTLRLGSRTWVILNSDRVVSDIIVKHGKITSDRPYSPIASGLVSNGKRWAFREFPKWQEEGRQVVQQLLNGSYLRFYGDWYETESIHLLSAYLDRPQEWYAHHFRYAVAVLYRLVLGEPFAKSKDDLDAYQSSQTEFTLSLNRHFVDFFPWLARLPRILQFWAPPWRIMCESHRKFFLSWWTPVADAVDAGTAPPSFTRDTLLHPETKYRGDREEAMYLALSNMGAGSDTARIMMSTFMMAMISHPAALSRLQTDLDACCNSSGELRLPSLTDMPSLPFCAATVKEVLRWRPIVPLNPPHELTSPLEYDGYRFPPGTSFLINNIALQDLRWQDGDKFCPERFIDNGNEMDPTTGLWAFGGGRRICPGYRVAQQALFVAFARIAYCFNIVADGEFDDQQLNRSILGEPFPVRIEPRSEAHCKLIQTEEAKTKESGRWPNWRKLDNQSNDKTFSTD